MKDKCGIVGVHSKDTSRNVANLIYYGLYALQHRGQESAGISTYNINYGLNHYVGMGLVTDVFNNALIKTLSGHIGIGHVRYSTTGQSKLENSQPFFTELGDGFISIAHNGDIVNSGSLKKALLKKGYEFKSDTDSEVICYLIKEEYENEKDILKVIDNVSLKLIGSYSLVILINDELYVVRDPMAMKPLVIGKANDMFIAASETVAFDVMAAEFIRDLEPGEVVYFKICLFCPSRQRHRWTKRLQCKGQHRCKIIRGISNRCGHCSSCSGLIHSGSYWIFQSIRRSIL